MTLYHGAVRDCSNAAEPRNPFWNSSVEALRCLNLAKGCGCGKRRRPATHFVSAIAGLRGDARDRQVGHGIKITCSEPVHEGDIPFGIEITDTNVGSAVARECLTRRDHAVLPRRPLIRSQIPPSNQHRALLKCGSGGSCESPPEATMWITAEAGSHDIRAKQLELWWNLNLCAVPIGADQGPAKNDFLEQLQAPALSKRGSRFGAAPHLRSRKRAVCPASGRHRFRAC